MTPSMGSDQNLIGGLGIGGGVVDRGGAGPDGNRGWDSHDLNRGGPGGDGLGQRGLGRGAHHLERVAS
jgi:hypothetical protein